MDTVHLATANGDVLLTVVVIAKRSVNVAGIRLVGTAMADGSNQGDPGASFAGVFEVGIRPWPRRREAKNVAKESGGAAFSH